MPLFCRVSPALFFLLVFLLATAVQLAVWWGVFARLAFYRHFTEKTAEKPLPCSVLLCARNAAPLLRRNLGAVLEQDYPDFDVLVVDDASTDDTAAVLAFFQKKYPRLRSIRLSEKASPGKKAALARGIAEARHPLLVLTDADCRPAGPHWLKEMTRAFADPAVEIVLGYGPVQAEPGLLNRWVAYETIVTALQYGGFTLAGMPYMGVGRNLAWRKPVFERVGGFASHERLASGDDDLLVNAAARPGNTVLCFAPAAFVFSPAKNDWTAWFRQKRRHLSTGTSYRPLHRLALGATALSQVLHYGLGFCLLSAGFGTEYVLGGYFLRESTVWFLGGRICALWGERRLIPWLPALDALMSLYYALFVPFTLINRRNTLNPWT